MVSVSICSPSAKAATAFADLARRSPPNVFMTPAALCAAQDTGFADIRVLQAWDDAGPAPKLVGFWALQVRRPLPLWPAVLEALPYNYAFLSSPLVDPAFAGEVIPAFLTAIRQASDLPKVLHLAAFEQERPCLALLQRELAVQGGAHRLLDEVGRPFATRQANVKKSGSTRKKLRQDFNRLSALGEVELVNARAPAAVAAAFETFLALEQASWKGARGTALLCNPRDAAFVRRLISGLAAEGQASVAELRINGRTIAAQVLMYCGRTAYTWKIAFDADHARYSPGMLLVDRITAQLLADPDIEAIDSCSAGDGFMAKLWTGRRQVVEMLIQVGPGMSPAFTLEALRRRGYHAARRLRNRWRARRHPEARAERAALAPS